MKRIIRYFVILWIALLGISFFTASESISVFARLGFTSVMAMIGVILILGRSADKRNSGSSGYKNCDIYYPTDSKVLYRVRNRKKYKGLDAAPIYEIKGKELYPVLGLQPIYHIVGNKVYRKLEPAPVFEIRGNKIYLPLSSKIPYEIK